MGADTPSNPPPPEPSVDAPRIPALKRRYRKPDEPEPEPLPEVDEAALLSVVLQSVQRRKGTKQVPERRGIRRFLPRAMDAAPAAAPPVEAVESVEADESRKPPVTVPRVALGRIARPRVRMRPPEIRYDLVVYAALAGAVLLAAFLAGRRSVPPAAAAAARRQDAAATAASLPNFPGQMARALAAEHAGDLSAALQITQDLTRGVEPGPDLLAYQSTLRTRLGLSNDVEAELARRLRADPSPAMSAALNGARAFNYARGRQFDEALPCFAAVEQNDPFDVANLLHWGETLRRKGSFSEADRKFEEALSRMPVATSPYLVAQHEYIAYERRLCQVESGRLEDLEPELERHLDGPARTGYWSLTAAAVALQKGNMPGGVDALTKARDVFSPAQFAALQSDYFFQAFAYRPELNALLATTTPEQRQARLLGMDYYVDP